jgi:hypothetical protein
MRILYSPKKSKSPCKRLYIRSKKIPRWAEDLEKVNEMVRVQNDNPDINPNAVYGCCIVERLNTNVIFNAEGKYYRGSSAKWNRNPFNQFIT